MINSGINKKNLSILHCISDYPTDIKKINLASISYLKDLFNLDVGLSDHTKSTSVPSFSVFAGAKIIEKHFTLRNNLTGPDHKASLNPKQFKKMVQLIRQSEIILGDKIKNVEKSEFKNRIFIRESLVAYKKIKKGEKFTNLNISTKRPGGGICASKYFNYLGKLAKKNYEKNDKI